MLTGENKGKNDISMEHVLVRGDFQSVASDRTDLFLLFIKRLDDLHTAREKQANRLGKLIKEPIFGPGQDKLRWSRFRKFEAEEMFKTVN